MCDLIEIHKLKSEIYLQKSLLKIIFLYLSIYCNTHITSIHNNLLLIRIIIIYIYIYIYIYVIFN